jgi:penicillin-binding protein 1C
VIHPAPGGTGAVVTVRAIGARERVSWLLNGRMVGIGDSGSSALRVRLDQAGEHVLTAIDGQGRYQSVRFSLR